MKEHGKSKEPRQVCTGIPYSSLRDSTHAHEALCELICAYCNDEEIGEQSSTEDEPSAVDLAFGIHYLLFRNSERLAVLVLILEGSPWDDSNFEQPSDAMEKLIKRRAAELDHDRHRFVEAVRWLCSNKSLSPAGRPSRTHVKTGGFRFG